MPRWPPSPCRDTICKPVQIIPVKLSMVNTYIVKQDGAILIDTGIPGSETAILDAMGKAGIAGRDLRLIIVTHGHGDHAGSAARLREVTGAKVAVHEKDAEMLRTGTHRAGLYRPGLSAGSPKCSSVR
jgi:hydroxyacylglutathione hydrolase